MIELNHILVGGLWISVALASGGPGLALAQGRLLGVVRDSSGAPLAQAEVLLPSIGRSTFSDSGGRFSLGQWPRGHHRGLIRRPGYSPLFFELENGGDDTLEVEFTLRRQVQTLDSVIVRGEPTEVAPGIRRRQEGGVGQFRDESFFRTHQTDRFTDVLRQLRGVRIVTNGRIRTLVSTRGASFAGECEVPVFLNGLRVAFDDFDLDDVRTGDVVAMELYTGAATTPPEFGGTPPRAGGAGAVCGALVVWMK